MFRNSIFVTTWQSRGHGGSFKIDLIDQPTDIHDNASTAILTLPVDWTGCPLTESEWIMRC